MEPEELFARLDRNGDSSINLVEMRSGLVDVGFELGDIIDMIRIFDKNLNGIVEKQEFYDKFNLNFKKDNNNNEQKEKEKESLKKKLEKDE